MKKYISFALVIAMIFVLFAVMPNTALTVSDTNTNFLTPIEPIPDGVDVMYISTPEELVAIGGAMSAGRYYALNNDIDLTNEWIPIDNFQGTFDGREYSINNLYILANSKREYSGLFGYIYAEEVTIKNVAVNIGEQGVSGASYAGGLLGNYSVQDNYILAIENCYTTGNVSTSIAGGLIGNCTTYSYGKITVINCYTTGNILGLVRTGGLIGSCRSNATITNCYATGDVSGSIYAGGLSGRFDRIRVENCYATGNIFATSMRYNGSAYAGGLVGYCNLSSKITNSYAIGNVSATSIFSNVGGLIGYTETNNPVNNCYRLSTQTLTGTRVDSSGIELTPEQMKDSTNFTGWDFDNVWRYKCGVNNDYPVLLAFFPVIIGDVDGDGYITENDARLILQYIVGLIELKEWQKEAADVFGDDEITAANATFILHEIEP